MTNGILFAALKWPARPTHPQAWSYKSTGKALMKKYAFYYQSLNNGDMLEFELGGPSGEKIRLYKKMDRFYLQVGNDDNRVQLFAQQEKVTIGLRSPNNFRITNRYVSGQHLELDLNQNGTLRIQDISKNGTAFELKQAPPSLISLHKTRLVNPNLGYGPHDEERPDLQNCIKQAFVSALDDPSADSGTTRTLTFFIDGSGRTTNIQEPGFYRIDLILTHLGLHSPDQWPDLSSILPIPYIQFARLDERLMLERRSIARTLWRYLTQANQAFCTSAYLAARPLIQSQSYLAEELLGIINQSCGLRNNLEKWMAMTDGPDVVEVS